MWYNNKKNEPKANISKYEAALDLIRQGNLVRTLVRADKANSYDFESLNQAVVAYDLAPDFSEEQTVGEVDATRNEKRRNSR